MKILTFSTLYPNSAQPSHGLFVEHRLRQLIAHTGVEARVVAPVPWFPSTNLAFGSYAGFARVPLVEKRGGIEILHPRYPVIPKIGMSVAPLLMALAVAPTLKRMIREGYDFDLIDAHFFYPDGVAAAILGKQLGKPVVITARGTDIHTYPAYRLPRRMILWAARQAAAVISVCRALEQTLADLGVEPAKLNTLRNGVDLELFCPGDRDEARKRLGFRHKTLLCVGALRKLKGHELVIQALAELDDIDLVIVGSGEEDRRLRALANKLGLAERVRFIPTVQQHELLDYYRAADALVLASSREGWPNVLLESMACGTPVIASSVWGIPEVVQAPEAGVLLSERSPQGIVEAVAKLFGAYPKPMATRRYAETFDWEATSRGQQVLFEKIILKSSMSYKADVSVSD